MSSVTSLLAVVIGSYRETMVKATVSLHSVFEVLRVFHIHLAMGQNAMMNSVTYSRGLVTTVSHYSVVMACRRK